VDKFGSEEMKEQFEMKLQNRFLALAHLTSDEESTDEIWTAHEEVFVETAANVVGYRRGKPQERWISEKNMAVNRSFA